MVTSRDTVINIGQAVDLSKLITVQNAADTMFFGAGSDMMLNSSVVTPPKTTTYIVRGKNMLCFDEKTITVKVRDLQIVNADNARCDPFKNQIKFNLVSELTGCEGV